MERTRRREKRSFPSRNATHLPLCGTGVLISPQRVCFNKRDASRAVAETGTGETDCCCLNSRSWGGCLAVTGLQCACACQITTIQALLGDECNFLDLIIHGFASVMRLIFSVQMWQIVISLMTPQTKQFNATDRVRLYWKSRKAHYYANIRHSEGSAD